MYGCESWTWKRLSVEKLKILSFGAGEDSWESLEQHEIKLVNPKGNQPWFFTGRHNATTEAPILWPIWCEELTHGKRPWILGKIEGRRRKGWQGWDGWMASPTQWTWVCAISGRWWRTGKPGMLQPVGLQRVGHHWQTEQPKLEGIKQQKLNVFLLKTYSYMDSEFWYFPCPNFHIFCSSHHIK